MSQENADRVQQIISEVEKVMVGKREVIELAVVALLAKGHLLLEDVPGVGKTTIAKTLAKVIGCEFSRIQFTPDTLPGDITGVNIYKMNTGTFEYVKGSVVSQIVLADEINRAAPKTQSSLLEAMEEKQVSVDRETHTLPAPFMVIATQNPIDFIGTYQLPEAQLDRFFMKLSVGYPNHLQEAEMVNRYLDNKAWKKVSSILTADDLRQMQEEVEKVSVKEELIEYVIKIVNETRNNKYFALGASPRATMALMQGAKARAYCKTRNYVTPDDILAVMKPVLWHRLQLSSSAILEQMTIDKIMAQIKAKVAIPILKSE